jgi:hypothetical protein
VDAARNAYLSGYSDSASGFPVTGGPGAVLAGLFDAFVVTIMPSGEDLYYAKVDGGDYRWASARYIASLQRCASSWVGPTEELTTPRVSTICATPSS